MHASVAGTAHRDQVLAFRLDRHNLAVRLPRGALLAAAGACGLQNTPPGSAGLALHARVAGLSPGEVNAALESDKVLLQAWSLRAAPHVFPTMDAPVFTLGLLPVDEGSIRAFIVGVEAALDEIGISATEVVELTAGALCDRLDGRAMTKDELGIELAEWVSHKLASRQLIPWRLPSPYAAAQSLGESVIRFALPITALRGLCCHAERRGNKAMLMRTDQWLSNPVPEVDQEKASAELVRRYLHCYGPSSVEHFSEWAGIASMQAARAWKLVEHELVQIDFDGRMTWLHQEDRERFKSPPAPAGVRFLPPGDPYLNLRDRATFFPDKALQRHIWRRSGNPGVVLAEGRPAAMWRPEKKGNRLAVSVVAFTSLPQRFRPEIEAEAETLAPFRGCSSVQVKFKDGI